MTSSLRRPLLAGTAALLAGLLLVPPWASAATTALDAGSTRTPVTAPKPNLPLTVGLLAPGGRSRVIVTLRHSTDLTSVPNLGHSPLPAAVVQRLRADAASSQAPLRAHLRALAATGDVADETSLWITNAIAVTASASAVRELAARPDVATVTPDAITVVPTSAPPEPNVAQVGATELWADGQTGQGVVVATLDSGVDTSNPDLAARWRGGSNSWFDPYGQHSQPADLSGHGTATTGVIVGGDAAGTSYGMAPGATWIAARIFNDSGAASATAIHQAFQWLLDPDGDQSTADAPQVVNGSWALGTSPSCTLTFQPDVRALRAAGILTVFSAGNFGPNGSTSVSPANYPESLSVATVDGSDAIWAYSSSGPSSCGGRTRVFPDLVAPGVSILAADRYGTFSPLSGTSIAAPHVAGALALLLGAHPGLDVPTQEAALVTTAKDLGAAGPDDRYGYGRLDVAAASAWITNAPDLSLSVTPASTTTLAGGSATYAVTATPVNGFTAATALSLAGLDPTLASWSFSPAVLGPDSWASSLTVSTTSALAPGIYPLTVTATGGGLSRAVAMSLTVQAVPDFTLSVSPSALSVKRGKSGNWSVSVGFGDGFSSPVSLSVSGLPAGVKPSWSRNPLAASGSSTLSVAVGSSVRRGTYPVVVTGSSAGVVRSVSASLSVT